MNMTGMPKRVQAGILDVAYEEWGPANAPPTVLLHGFPYDIRAFDGVAPLLATGGRRVVVPYLRGYGPTRFLDRNTPRSGQQAVLGADLLALLDALAIDRAMLGGYDWGGRAACIVAALHPERVSGLVSVGGYNIQDIARAGSPGLPEQEHRLWYQYYLHGARGAAGLAAHRRDFCRLLWRLWSPGWRFDEATFEATAASFDNADFVAVVVHSYRHRFGLVEGDPAAEPWEALLAAQPPITVPTIVLDGAEDGVASPEGSARHARHFTGPYRREIVAGAGHNLPQEQPEAMAQALLALG